jgi:hypothetical protein
MKKAKKMAFGGGVGPEVRKRVDPKRAMTEQNTAVHQDLAKQARQYPLYSPERHNYTQYMRQAFQDNKAATAALPRGTVAPLTPAPYDPNTTYTLSRAPKTSPQSTLEPRPVRRAKGGSVKSPTSRRGDGIASRGGKGPTKGKSRAR